MAEQLVQEQPQLPLLSLRGAKSCDATAFDDSFNVFGSTPTTIASTPGGIMTDATYSHTNNSKAATASSHSKPNSEDLLINFKHLAVTEGSLSNGDLLLAGGDVGERKVLALERRLRTVQDILQKQNASQEKLMGFCRDMYHWVVDVDTALRQNGFALRKAPEPIFGRMENKMQQLFIALNNRKATSGESPMALRNSKSNGSDGFNYNRGDQTTMSVPGQPHEMLMSMLHPQQPPRHIDGRFAERRTSYAGHGQWGGGMMNSSHSQGSRVDWDCDSENDERMPFSMMRQNMMHNNGHMGNFSRFRGGASRGWPAGNRKPSASHGAKKQGGKRETPGPPESEKKDADGHRDAELKLASAAESPQPEASDTTLHNTEAPATDT